MGLRVAARRVISLCAVCRAVLMVLRPLNGQTGKLPLQPPHWFYQWNGFAYFSCTNFSVLAGEKNKTSNNNFMATEQRKSVFGGGGVS